LAHGREARWEGLAGEGWQGNRRVGALLRTEVRLRLADIPFLFMTSVVVQDLNGSGTVSVARLAQNHNETLVRDAAPME
jgi:hypothetical protein